MVQEKKQQATPNDDFSTPSILDPKKRKRSTTIITQTMAKCSTRRTPTKGRSSRVRKLVPAGREICDVPSDDSDTEATFVLNKKGGQDDIATYTDGDSSETNNRPPFSIKNVANLEYSIEDMTTKYKRSSELLKEKDAEIKRITKQLDKSTAKCWRVTSNMEIVRKETTRLEKEVEDLKQVRSALEKECEKRAREFIFLRLYADDKEEEIDKMHEEKMNYVDLKERYEECTERVLELEIELQDAKVRLEISEDQAYNILREKEEKISELQTKNGNLEAELEEARRAIKCLENASNKSSKLESFGPKTKERDLRFLETADSWAFNSQKKNLTISRSGTENLQRNNQISNNIEEESPAPQPRAQSIGSSAEVPLEIPSSPQHTKPIVDQQLSRLRPPPKQNPNDHLSPRLLELSKEIVPRVKSFLVSQLTSKNTTHLNTMIDLANDAFSTLDWCCTDYSSFHCDICNFIHCYSNRLAAEEERNKHVYAQILVLHDELVNRANDAEEALMNAEGELTTAVEKLEPLKSEIVKVRELLRQLEKEMADGEVEIEALKGKRDGCADELSNAENEALKMSWRRWEIDQRIESAMEADERMRDQLRSHIC